MTPKKPGIYIAREPGQRWRVYMTDGNGGAWVAIRKHGTEWLWLDVGSMTLQWGEPLGEIDVLSKQSRDDRDTVKHAERYRIAG